jgi:hypothetical protein
MSIVFNPLYFRIISLLYPFIPVKIRDSMWAVWESVYWFSLGTENSIDPAFSFSGFDGRRRPTYALGDIISDVRALLGLRGERI